MSCTTTTVAPRDMFDVIVIGGGPAGLSAALMLGRCRRRVLLCDSGKPRNARSKALHGYLTRDGVAPVTFNRLGRHELKPYGVEFRRVGITRANPHRRGFRVSLADGRREASRFLLLATGVIDELPAIDGLSACYGRSAFHCPYCDGWEWRERRLAVLGNGVSGAQLALSLKTWSHDVLLCSNGMPVASRARARLHRNDIVVRTQPITRLVHRRGRLAAIAFGAADSIACDALFFSTGQRSHSNIADRLGCAFTPRGTVNTGSLCNTNIPRLFVAGDASRDAQFVVVAAAEGTKAALAINQALQREELVP